MVGPYRLPCETPEAHRPQRALTATRWVLPATILGSSLGFIDGSVVNVALPAAAALAALSALTAAATIAPRTNR
jgi:hypothetical protein